MKKIPKWFWGLLAPLGVIIVLLIISIVNTPSSPATSWDYVFHAPRDKDCDKFLRTSGDAGWRVVYARRVQSKGGGEMKYEFLLEKAK